MIPPSIERQPDAKATFLRQMQSIQKSYNQMFGLRGFPTNDALYLLPNACETKLVMTMNARSLYNFFTQRMCMRAQWEIRQMAELMRQRITSGFPLCSLEQVPSVSERGFA